jgi:hypothetical protein
MAMPVNQGSPVITAEGVEHIRMSGKSVELVRGRLVGVEPPGTHRG